MIYAKTLTVHARHVVSAQSGQHLVAGGELDVAHVIVLQRQLGEVAPVCRRRVVEPPLVAGVDELLEDLDERELVRVAVGGAELDIAML